MGWGYGDQAVGFLSGRVLCVCVPSNERVQSKLARTIINTTQSTPVAGDELAAGLLGDLRRERAGVADVAQELCVEGGRGLECGGLKGVRGWQGGGFSECVGCSIDGGWVSRVVWKALGVVGWLII